MWEDLAIGLITGLILGGAGSIYLVFRRGYVQALVFDGIKSYSDQLVAEITEKPEILRPYVELLVKQIQDPQIVQAIVGPFMKEVFSKLPIAPDGQGGIDLKAVPKEWRWLAQIGMQLFGPKLQEMLGAGGSQAATDLLGLPLR